MPPFFRSIAKAVLLGRDLTGVEDEIRSQWINPGNILDILLLVGGDVVRVALAQLTGSRFPTPVVFSFGWVAYTFNALVSVIGDKHLMPPPDVQSIVINAKTGYIRNNQSWILGRLLRDFEDGHWMHDDIKQKLYETLNPPAKIEHPEPAPEPSDNKVVTQTVIASPPIVPGQSAPAIPALKPEPVTKAGLCISIYEADPDHKAEDIVAGKLFWFGYAVAVTQLVIAALPCFVFEEVEYMTFIFTLGGTLLAFAMASLPQWRRKKFGCRKNTNLAFVLTRGNGAQHALVVLGEKRGLNFEDLATSGEGVRATWPTRTVVFTFTVLWVVLLICVDGLNTHTWFLVAVGSLGSVYTSLVAGLQRKPEHFGIPLRWTGKCFVNKKAMIALMEAEQYRSGLGRSMLETFFPGSRSEAEEKFWSEAKTLNDLVDPPFVNDAVTAQAAKGVEDLAKQIAEKKAENDRLTTLAGTASASAS